MAGNTYDTIERPYNNFLERSEGIPEAGVPYTGNASLGSVNNTDTEGGNAVTNPGDIDPGSLEGEALNNLWIKTWIKSRNYLPKKRGFLIDGENGYIEAADIYLTGSIVAAAGTIGGFEIGSDYIRDAANSFGLASTVTGGDDVRFWAGDTFANRATADFIVTEAGAVTASNITITGGSVVTSILSGTIAQGNLNVADRGWSQTSAFSVTDADTVAWGAGTFTSADGTAYSIGAGNTGNMVAKTYIYLDTAVSTTAYQTTTTATTAVGAGKVLIAIAQNGTGEATFTVLAGQGGQNIDAANIVAGSITANEIAASTITAGKLSISQLSAIAADLGTITAGTITGATIQTSASANTGIKFNSTAIYGYNASNVESFKLTAATGVVEATDGKYYTIKTAGENIDAGDPVCIKGGDETQAAGGSDHDASVEDTVAGAGGTPGSSATDMYVGLSGSSNQYYSYLRFASLTQSARVISCKLRLYCIAKVNSISTGISIQRVTSTWDESTIAGDSQPSVATSGHDTIAIVPDASIPVGGTFDIDITNLYRMWKVSGYSNFGIRIKTTTAAGVGAYYRFSTSESGGNGPKLIIVSNEVSDGKVYLANDANYNTVKSVIGVAAETITSGNSGKIQYAGTASSVSGTTTAGATAYINADNITNDIVNLTYAAQLGLCLDDSGTVFLQIVKPKFIENYHDDNDSAVIGKKYVQLTAGDTWECAAPPEAGMAIVTVLAGSAFNNFAQNDVMFQVPVYRFGRKTNVFDGFTATGTNEHDPVLQVDWDTSANYINITFPYEISGTIDLRILVSWFRY